MDFVILWKALSSYGVLGIMVVVEMFVIAKLYRDREAERSRHAAELAAYRDRYEVKAEKSADKIAELSAQAKAHADALERSIRARARRGSDVDPG